MERRAKERLIGAGILVALAVIVVPELLSGPKPEAARPEVPAQLPRPAGAPDPVRNVTVDLTTSKPPVTSAQAVAAPAAATVAAPPPAPTSMSTSASSREASSSTASQTAAASTATAPAAAPAVETAASPPRSAGAFAVQLGSFANRGNADNLVHQLKAQGYPVYMSSEGSGRTERYRVRVGPLNDRDAAEKTIAKLKASGHASTLIPPR